MNYQFLYDIDQHVLNHPQLKHAVQTIEQAIVMSQNSKDPVNVLLTGHAGTGKTTCCQKILSNHPQQSVDTDLGENTLIPAFYSLIPSPATIRSVAEGMLEKLVTFGRYGGTTMEMKRQLGIQLKNRQTQIIMLDELQHLLDNDKRTREVKKWIKDIINQFRVPLVVVGKPECAQVINNDDQLARRFPYQVELANLSPPTQSSTQFIEYVIALMSVFEKVCKVSFKINPKEYSDALSLYVATGGNPANISQLFKQAVINCKQDNRRNVTHLDFEVATNMVRLSARKSKVNPFGLDQKSLVTLVNQITRD